MSKVVAKYSVGCILPLYYPEEKLMFKAAVITVSDKGSRGEREDLSGPAVSEILKNNGFDVVYTSIIPDEMEVIEAEFIKLADDKIPLIVSTGGTGFSKRDVTPEATEHVCQRMAPGIGEMMRAASAKITNKACLSRETAGPRDDSLLVYLPGSPKAARENLDAVVASLGHGLEMLLGLSGECASAQPGGNH